MAQPKTGDRRLSPPQPIKGPLKVGHNAAEMYLTLGETVVVMPPVAFKQLAVALREVLGDIPVAPGRSKAAESVPRKVLRELYKGKKVSKRLISVNTKRRKHIEDSG